MASVKGAKRIVPGGRLSARDINNLVWFARMLRKGIKVNGANMTAGANGISISA